MPGMLCSQAARARRAGVGLHRAVEVRVEGGQAPRQPGQVGIEVSPEGRRGLVAPLLLRHADGEELAAAGDQGVQVLGGGIWARAHRRLDLGGEAGQHPGIQAVGLGQDVAAAGEVAHRPRIDHRHRQPGAGQGRIDRLLVAAAGLQHDAGGLQRPRPADHRRRGPPGVLGTRQASRVGCTAMSR